MTSRHLFAWAQAALLVAASACSSGKYPASQQQLVQLGDQLLTQKRFQEAANAYKQALESDPGNAAIRAKLGTAYAQGGDAVRGGDLLQGNTSAQLEAASALVTLARFDEAASRADQLLKDEPSNPAVYIVKGNAIAKLTSSTTALLRLADDVGDRDRFLEARRELRPPVSSEEEVQAEAAFRKASRLAPGSLPASLALANFLWATGRPDEAEAPLRAVIQAQPDHPVANFAIGTYYMASGREDEGVQALHRAAAAPDEAGRRSRLILADYYVNARRDEDARAVLQTAGTNDDDAGEVTVRLAGIDARTGQPANAVRRLDALLARAPNNTSALLLKAQILFKMGNPDQRYARAAVTADGRSSEARMLLGDVLSAARDLDGAMDQYEEASHRAPTAVAPRLALARTSLLLGKPSQAVLQAKEAVRLAPEDKDAVLTLVAALVAMPDLDAASSALAPLIARYPKAPDVALQEGRLASARNNAAVARAAFLRVLDADPGSRDALAGLVDVDARTSPAAATVERVEKALASHPADPALMLVAGRMYMSMRDTTRAEAVLRRAFVVDPSNVDVALTLARAVGDAGQPDKAIEVLQQAVERHPVRTSELRMALAAQFDVLGRGKDARAQYEQIVLEDPDATEASYRLANRYLDDPDKISAALELAMAAKRGRPTDPDVDLLLGRIYTAKGLTELAVPVLKRAIDARPQNALYHFQLAAAYERGGNLSLARDEYAAALRIDGSFPGAEKARQMTARR